MDEAPGLRGLELRRRPTIALLTDFGLEDTYVGVVKGVVLSRCPECAFIDLSHSVSPQNVREAAYLVWTAHRYMPEGTVIMCVVDPGVGTDRRAIAVRWPMGYFVGPDNGWLTYLIRDVVEVSKKESEVELPRGWRLVELTRDEFRLETVSTTFHGRDIFAPAAAALACGTAMERIGEAGRTLKVLSVPEAENSYEAIKGYVVHIDHFGNLVTDVPARCLATRFRVTIGTESIEGLDSSYQVRKPLAAMVGSNGLLEIAAPNSSAARILKVAVGEWVSVVNEPDKPSDRGSR